MDNFLCQDIQMLRGVGESTAKRLNKIGITTIFDILVHFPKDYQDRSKIHRISDIYNGQKTTVTGQILYTNTKQKTRKILECFITDNTSPPLILRFFHFGLNLQKQLKAGHFIKAWGEVRYGYKGYEMTHPQIQIFEKDKKPASDPFLYPIYATTTGITQKQIHKYIKNALDELKTQDISEILPKDLMQEYRLNDFITSLNNIHCVKIENNVENLTSRYNTNRLRFVIEEILSHQLTRKEKNKKIKDKPAAQIVFSQDTLQETTAVFEHEPTRAQIHVIEEICCDLTATYPMTRLLQGDVGSGKTFVAFAVAAQMIKNSYQVALMAPTEILAEQHFRVFMLWCKKLNIKCELLYSNIKIKKKQQILLDLLNNKINFIIGTHALIQKNVIFANLGLVIIDEQHRFGVSQRSDLLQKGVTNKLYPHQLMMSATPIPRTLAQTAYANMSLSVIDQLPKGRTKVITAAMSQKKRYDILQKLKEYVRHKKQVYWVCSLISESDFLQNQNATETYENLQIALPAMQIGLVHSKISMEEKEKTMNAFKNGELDILVATTVIEVGVDVPSASLMIIEDANRFGLSQLHQLRGRVGRGSKQSYCILLYKKPLSNNSKARLNIMRSTNDGFVIAKEDLKLRGPGELLGTAQKGELELKLADLVKDEDLIKNISIYHNLMLERKETKQLLQRWLHKKIQYKNI
jgi:ATP-dependent DNA helicase RecG